MKVCTMVLEIDVEENGHITFFCMKCFLEFLNKKEAKTHEESCIVKPF